MGLLPGYERKGEGEQQYKRGEIFYVNNGSREQAGSETKKDRPAIIVSCDANNKHSSVLEMVFLTTQPKTDLPTHVAIRSTGRLSTALCEQPTPVSVERLNNYLGEVTDAEMQNIDAALLIGLGINYDKKMQKILEAMIEGKTASGGDLCRTEKENPESDEAVKQKEERIRLMEEENERLEKSIRDTLDEMQRKTEEAIRADAERSTYKQMYEELLKMVMK